MRALFGPHTLPVGALLAQPGRKGRCVRRGGALIPLVSIKVMHRRPMLRKGSSPLTWLRTAGRSLTTLYIGKDDTTQHGRWTQSGSQVVMTFDAMGAKPAPHPITFRHHDHELRPIHWDPSEWGRAGPPVLHRSRASPGRLLIMSAFYNIMLGYFFGFALGVGCALAVFYAIYSGGYRKAVEDSLLEEKPKRYQEAMVAANRRAERAKESR